MAVETYSFRFKELELEGALVAWNDTIGIRLARHAYLKRDGAEQEPMGAEPGRFTMRIALLGASWASNYRALVASIRQEPRGLLVHPVLGNVRVACTGISDASCEPGRAKRLLEVTLGFEEDALDTALSVEAFTAPAVAAARVKQTTKRLQSTATKTPSAASAVAKLVTTATSFADTATAIAGGVANASLAAKLAATGSATDLAIAALVAAPEAVGARVQPAVSAAVEVYGACVQLDDALAAMRPAIVDYPIAGSISLFVLVARLYPGEDAQRRAQDLLALNRIPNPLAIPPGTKLRLPRPTAV